MKIRVLFLILWVSVSCGSRDYANETKHSVQQSDTTRYMKHTYNYFPSAFLDVDFDSIVEVFDILPYGKKIKDIKNNIEEEDFVMFDLLQKRDSMYYVIAYSGLTDDVLAIGSISQNTKLGVY